MRDKFGVDLTNAHGKLLAKINRIIQRGHLKSDDEFRMLSSRVEEIYADDSKQNEVEILNKLMYDYETNKKVKILKSRTKEEILIMSYVATRHNLSLV